CASGYACSHNASFSTRVGYVRALQYVHRPPLSAAWKKDTEVVHMQCELGGTINIKGTTRDTASREIARKCVLTRVRQISRALTAIYDEAMRPFGVVASQLTLLVLVAEFGPLSRSDLA